ncbi:TIGR04282 family arsenosugar biosynthesis glycosyltransferase [Nitrospira sp. Kam-Ns4a]
MNAALVIFAKAPVPGQVKTRLCPPLTPDEAASLHGSLVLDALERARAAARMDRFVACAPTSNHVFFKILEERYSVRLLDQVGEDLGTRMRRIFDLLFARSYGRVVLTGTDVPRLPASAYEHARGLLGSHELVLGPAVDGGYYLIGLSRPAPDLFAGIPWSTDQVLACTQQKARALGLKTALLPPCRDLDTIEDLRAVIRECGLDRKGTSGKPAAGVPDLSKRTAGVLRLLAERLPARTDQPDG